MESIEVEFLSPEDEFVRIQTSRGLALGEVVRLADKHGHACSGVVAERSDVQSPLGIANLAVRLDVCDWQGDWSGPPPRSRSG